MEKLLKIFTKDREQVKEHLIKNITESITNNYEYKFTHAEQTEILNKINLSILENKKDIRTKLLTEARELQNSLVEISI